MNENFRSRGSSGGPRRALASAILLSLVLLLESGCAPTRPPVLEPLRDKPQRSPVVMIPGITGTQLRDSASGRVVWGKAKNVFFPRDGGYGLALPIDPTAREADRIEAFAPVLDVRLLGLIRREVYSPLVRVMHANGYHLGTLADPDPDDSFFFLLYDWRRGVEHAAAVLLRDLESLRRSRGDPKLRVTLICQSDGAMIGRYFAKYGGADLERAESGAAGLPESIEIEKLILVGSSNGGALRTLHEMNHGRRYTQPFGRRIRQETMFTYSSLFQGLPTYRKDLFFDEAGQILEVDLFDPETWNRYGWSVHEPRTRKRLDKLGRTERFGDADAREHHLAVELDRAARLHRLLATDPEGFAPPAYYSLQDPYLPSPERAMLARDDGRWRTYFMDDRPVKRDPFLLSLAKSPGDGHATLDSQYTLSPKERAALAIPPVHVEGGHFPIVLNPATHRRILEFLLD